MKEILNRPEERLKALPTLPIAGFALWGDQLSGPVASGLRRGIANGLGQRGQHLDSALVAERNQVTSILARIQHQGSNPGAANP
jgi:hypothetical protein